MTQFIVLGSMSGTSKDGHDIAKLKIDVCQETGAVRTIEWLSARTYLYTAKERDLLAQAETLYLHDKATCAEIESIMTAWHIRDFKQFLQEFPEPMPTLLGYHGQTIYHAPEQGLTVQLGDGHAIARALNMPVVFDIRSADVKAGGQGAPLAGILHQALALATFQDKLPVVVVNIGGIANISVVWGFGPDELCSFDTGPGNALINACVASRTDACMDEDGRYGLQGKVDDAFVQQHVHRIFKDETYLARPYPKSLDVNGLKLLSAVAEFSLEDACAFYESMTAYCLAAAVDHLPAHVPVPTQWILAGGGSKNTMIKQQLQHYLKIKNMDAQLIMADSLPGWENDALEAGLFAYLAVRHCLELPTSYPSMTGVLAPVKGGVFADPLKITS